MLMLLSTISVAANHHSHSRNSCITDEEVKDALSGRVFSTSFDRLGKN